MVGNPSFNVQLGDIQYTETTLDEIFKYLTAADKPCIVAIDEFQQIAAYPEKNIEALLRTYVQRCPTCILSSPEASGTRWVRCLRALHGRFIRAFR